MTILEYMQNNPWMTFFILFILSGAIVKIVGIISIYKLGMKEKKK